MAGLSGELQEKHGTRGLIAGYIVLNVTGYTVGGAMYFLVPLYALHLQATTLDIGVIRGISGLGTLLLVIPAGFLVDHFGTKRLYLAGSLAGTLVILLLAFTKTPLALAVLVGVGGLFNSLKSTALNASFFRDLQTMGVEKSGWFKGSMSIGLTFTGPLLGGLLVKRLGFGAIFQILAWLTFIPMGLVFFFHKEPVQPGSISELVESIGSQLQEFRRLLCQRSFYLPLMTEVLSTACFTTFGAFIVVIAVQSLHVQPAVASSFLTVEGGVFILTVFLAGPVVLRCSFLRLSLASFAVTSIGLVGLSLAGGFHSATICTVVLGLGLGLINVMVSSRIALMQGEKGKIVGLTNAAVAAGIFGGPILGGLVGQLLGNHFIFVAFVPLFLVLASLVMIKEARLQPPSEGGCR